MTREVVVDWLALLFFVAIVFLLVRPGSKAAETVEAIGGMLVNIVRTATDVAT